MKKMFRKKTNIGETGDPEKEELAEVQVESELPASELKQEDKEFESFFSEVLKKLPQKTSANYLVGNPILSTVKRLFNRPSNNVTRPGV